MRKPRPFSRHWRENSLLVAPHFHSFGVARQGPWSTWVNKRKKGRSLLTFSTLFLSPSRIVSGRPEGGVGDGSLIFCRPTASDDLPPDPSGSSRPLIENGERANRCVGRRRREGPRARFGVGHTRDEGGGSRGPELLRHAGPGAGGRGAAGLAVRRSRPAGNCPTTAFPEVRRCEGVHHEDTQSAE